MWDDRSFLHLKKAQESKGREEKRNPSYLEKKCIILQFSSHEEKWSSKKLPNDKLVLPKTRSETKFLNICNLFCQCTLVFHYLVKEGVSHNSCQNCIYNTTLVWLGFATAPDAGSCTPETPSSLSLTLQHHKTPIFVQKVDFWYL